MGPFMTTRSLNSETVPAGKKDTNAIIARWRHESGATVLVLVSLAVIVIVAWILYDRPAHSYRMGANTATWSADVKIALSESVPVGPITPTGPLSDIPGVGKIVNVIVNKADSGKKVAVLFLTGEGVNESGLVYLNGFPPPSDTCNVHLNGPWWQVGPLNTMTMGCERGFHFTGGG
jgi:hypothetical protein